MSGQHTQGRLEANDAGYLTDATGQCIAAVGNWEGHANMVADARRLAACWNFCQGMPTETVEGARKPAFQYLTDADQHSHKLTKQLAAARKLLAEVHSDYGGVMDDEQNPLLFRIRAFLKGKS